LPELQAARSGETGWIRKPGRSEALLPSIDEPMGGVLLRVFGGGTDGPPDQFTARSLLRAIAAGMIARCSSALCAGMAPTPRRQLHYCNKFRKQ
jgi:hypothetical protein